MNKSAFFLAASISLLFLYIIVYRFDPDEYREMAQFAPADSLAYVTQTEGVDLLKEFRDSTLYKKLIEIDANVVDPLLGQDHLIAGLQMFLSSLADVSENRLVDEIFGKKYAFIIFRPESIDQPVDQGHILRENLVVIAEPRSSGSLLHMIGRKYADMLPDLTVVEKQYGRHLLSGLTLNGQSLYLANIRGFFLFSLHEQRLRDCIDAFDGDRANLISQSDFVEIRRNYNDANIFAYFPLDSLRNFAAEVALSKDFVAKEIVLKELDTTKGFSALGYGNWIHKGYVRDKTIVRYSSERVNSLVREHLQIIPTTSTMLSLGTRDPMFYYWSNALNLKHFLLYVEDGAGSELKAGKLVKKIENIVGMKASDILKLLDDEVSLIVENSPDDLFFPFPGAVALVQTDNGPELKEIIDKVLNAHNIPMRKISYGPAKYYYWSRSPQDGLQPLYGFWDDLFFIGNSSATVQRVIDQNITGISILDNKLFRKADPGFESLNNSTTFSDNVKLMKVLHRALEMFGTFIALENRETAMKAKILLKELITPLMEGLTIFDSMATRSYFTPETVVVESVINLSPQTQN